MRLLDSLASVFARDKPAYWWNYFTDEEKKLRRMNVRELASLINESKVRNLTGDSETLIVAEHLLRERIALIQSRPAWFAIWAGLLGVVGGAVLTSSLQQPNEANKCVCECKSAGTLQYPSQQPINTATKNTAVRNGGNVPVSNNQKQQKDTNTSGKP